MADLNRFFTALSERMYKENNLSDVTYALCEADVKFRQFFLDFFFRDARLKAGEVTIERETSFKNSGRPDFCIWTRDGGLYVVEVKIYDGNHHFGQYRDILKKEACERPITDDEAWKHLGYVANYKEVKNVEIENGNKTADEVCSRVATWSEFVDGLERYLGFDDPTIRGYIEYVRHVCPYDDFKIDDAWEICAEQFKAVREFDKALENAIRQNGCTVYSRSTRDFVSMQWIGHFFDWQLNGDVALSCRGWIGAYYRQGEAVVCVEFEERWIGNRDICAKFRGEMKNGTLRFYAPKADGQVGNGDSGNGQAETGKRLNSFLADVLRSVETKHMEEGVQLTESTAGLAGGLLPMKCLPRLLETSFLSSELTKELGKRGCEIALSPCREAEVPQSHCGRYFSITTRRKECCGGNEVCRIWVGVIFQTDKKDKDNDFSNAPKFVLEVPLNSRAVSCCSDGWRTIKPWGQKFIAIDDGGWRDVFRKVQDELCKVIADYANAEKGA